MRKLLITTLVAFMMVGCTTQPYPTTSGGESSSKVELGNGVHVFTLFDKLELGTTHITAEEGASINIGTGSTPPQIKF